MEKSRSDGHKPSGVDTQGAYKPSVWKIRNILVCDFSVSYT